MHVHIRLKVVASTIIRHLTQPCVCVTFVRQGLSQICDPDSGMLDRVLVDGICIDVTQMCSTNRGQQHVKSDQTQPMRSIAPYNARAPNIPQRFPRPPPPHRPPRQPRLHTPRAPRARHAPLPSTAPTPPMSPTSPTPLRRRHVPMCLSPLVWSPMWSCFVCTYEHTTRVAT